MPLARAFNRKLKTTHMEITGFQQRRKIFDKGETFSGVPMKPPCRSGRTKENQMDTG